MRLGGVTTITFYRNRNDLDSHARACYPWGTMKKTSWLSLPVAALLAAAAFRPAYAQPGPPPNEEQDEEGPGGKATAKELKHPLLDDKAMAKLAARLELTEDQKKKFNAVIDKAKPDLEKKQAEVKAASEKMQAASKALKTAAGAAKESIRDSLTLEQKEKFDRQFMMLGMQNMRQMRKGRMGGRGGPQGMNQEIEIEEEIGPGGRRGGGRKGGRRGGGMMGGGEDQEPGEPPSGE